MSIIEVSREQTKVESCKNESQGKDTLVTVLIVGHLLYGVVSVVCFFVLILIALAPIQFYKIGSHEAINYPEELFIPSFIILVLFTLVTFFAVLTLSVRNVYLLQTQLALNFILGLGVAIMAFCLALFFGEAAFKNNFQAWIDGYEIWFNSAALANSEEWDSIQGNLGCCGSTPGIFLTVKEEELDILYSGLKCNLESTNPFFEIVQKLRELNGTTEELTRELDRNDASLAFCLETIENRLNFLRIHVMLFGIFTLVHVIWTTQLLARVTRRQMFNQLKYRTMKDDEEEERMVPELLEIYCDSFKMSTWRMSLRSSAEILTSYRGRFRREEIKASSRELEMVDVGVERNQSVTISLKEPPLTPSPRQVKGAQRKYPTVEQFSL